MNFEPKTTAPIPVTGKVKIVGIPTTQWERDNDESLGTFCWVIDTSTPWQTGAIIAHEQEITLSIPKGTDLLSTAIETLEKRKKEALDEYVMQIERCDAQLAQLRFLAHMPEEDVIDA